MKIITGLYLSSHGKNHFAEWMAEHAKPTVKFEPTMVEMLNVMHERIDAGESRSYELGGQYTQSGRPEIFHAADSDFDIEFGDDD